MNVNWFDVIKGVIAIIYLVGASSVILYIRDEFKEKINNRAWDKKKLKMLKEHLQYNIDINAAAYHTNSVIIETLERILQYEEINGGILYYIIDTTKHQTFLFTIRMFYGLTDKFILRPSCSISKGETMRLR